MFLQKVKNFIFLGVLKKIDAAGLLGPSQGKVKQIFTLKKVRKCGFDRTFQIRRLSAKYPIK